MARIRYEVLRGVGVHRRPLNARGSQWVEGGMDKSVWVSGEMDDERLAMRQVRGVRMGGARCGRGVLPYFAQSGVNPGEGLSSLLDALLSLL